MGFGAASLGCYMGCHPFIQIFEFQKTLNPEQESVDVPSEVVLQISPFEMRTCKHISATTWLMTSVATATLRRHQTFGLGSELSFGLFSAGSIPEPKSDRLEVSR